jgi:hypothetical protein
MWKDDDDDDDDDDLFNITLVIMFCVENYKLLNKTFSRVNYSTNSAGPK